MTREPISPVEGTQELHMLFLLPQDSHTVERASKSNLSGRVALFLLDPGCEDRAHQTPLVADLFMFCYERDFMMSLSGDNY